MTNTNHLLPAGYLHVQGTQILDENNDPVRLCGVNWYGFDCNSLVAGGLDHLPIDTICGRIVDLGFNTIRIPYCVQLVQSNPPITRYVDAEPALQGKPAMDIMDALVASAGTHSLKVILDCHRSDAGWSTQSNGLWYTQDYPETTWLQSWQTIVERYAGTDTVIGCDLRNEIGSPPPDAQAWPANGGAVWGYGGASRDWQDAAQRAGNAILATNSNLLIFVEGTRNDPAGPQQNNDSYWFGGNLLGVGHNAVPHRLLPTPVTLDVPGRLVYSIHDYGPNMYAGLPWAQLGSTASTPAACYAVWDEVWGYLVNDGTAPIWIGEFGTPNGLKPGHTDQPQDYTDPNATNPQGSWFTYLVDYIQDHQLHWCYWCLNGTQSEAPGRSPAQTEGYGVLAPDWQNVSSQPLLLKLQSIQ